MKAKVLLTLGTILLLSLSTASARERTYMGHPVSDMKFPIAGGQEVSLPVTDAGPIPAEDKDYKIEVAGFSITPSLLRPKQAALAWQFALTAKGSQTLEHVKVEEVYPDDAVTVLVDDPSPSLQKKVWSRSSVGVEPNPISVPWLFKEGSSVFVMRFTISPAGKPPVVLYQPVWFSKPVKETFRQQVLQINAGR